MRRAFTSCFTVLTLLLIAIGCRTSADTNKAETQSQFGVRMAKMNLWREAMFRFRRAVQINPDDAEAHNNLAVALEANGNFDEAAKEYREALRLDRTDPHIQKNYSRFVEFTQKAKKREAAAATAASNASANAPTTTAATTATATATTDTAPPPAAPPPTDTTATTTTTTTNPPDGGSR